VTPRFPSPQPSPEGEGAGSSARRGPPAFQVCEFLCGGIRNPESGNVAVREVDQDPRVLPPIGVEGCLPLAEVARSSHRPPGVALGGHRIILEKLDPRPAVLRRVGDPLALDPGPEFVARGLECLLAETEAFIKQAEGVGLVARRFASMVPLHSNSMIIAWYASTRERRISNSRPNGLL